MSYLWCGARICQARDSGNAMTRSYYDEGELILGAPALIEVPCGDMPSPWQFIDLPKVRG
jgi:hypothetical protein